MVRNLAPSRGRNRDRDTNRRTGPDPRQGRNHRNRGLWTYFPVYHKRLDQDRRRNGNRLSSGRPVEGYGDGPVPSNTTPEHGNPNHRSSPWRGRLPAQQGRRTLSQEVRAEQDGTRSERHPIASRNERDQRRQRIRRTIRQLRPP